MDPTETRLELFGAQSARRQAARVIAADYLDRLRAGERLDGEAIIAEHPDLAPELQEELRAAAVIARGRLEVNHLDDALDTASPGSASSDTLMPGELGYLVPAELGNLAAGDIPGYEILDEIHRGGQGVVFRALQLSTRREVAVKVLLEGPSSGVRARARFEREVHLVAQLKHPNIVVVHDSGITHGQYYFAMDLVDGAPLDEYVRRAQPDLHDLTRLYVQICDAMGCAHRRGVIHRDLKPANILVDAAGKPFVVDFGLAKMTDVDAARERSMLTETGHLLGTILYMSPEQTRGDHEAIDSRSDVYSLGLILYQLITGKFPYDRRGDITDLIRAIREVDPPRPSRNSSGIARRIDTELDAIVLKAMAKEPDRRYTSASELQADLQAWINGDPVQARGATTFYLIRTLVRRHRFASAVLSLLAAIVLSSVALIGFFYLEAKAQNEAWKHSQAVNRVESAGWRRDTALEAVRKRIAEQSLGYFLYHWTAGRHDRAREYADKPLLKDSPYGAAMRFLLGDLSPEQLAADLEGELAGLTPFVMGVRTVLEGDLDAARTHFEQCVTVTPSGWLRKEAHAHLRQLSTLRVKGGAAGGEVGE